MENRPAQGGRDVLTRIHQVHRKYRRGAGQLEREG
jgi:hypothetical protein